ncbi:MAG: hypothetical protein NDI82_05495 [Anaeromyxobacteraceae bacterium]|nr:hypothetical protein [Anaeromyxobacteraceae bacterium]
MTAPNDLAAGAPPRARTFTGAAALLLLVAGLVGAPEAGVAVAGLAALAALVPVASGPRRWRVAGLALLALSLALAASLWPGAALRR